MSEFIKENTEKLVKNINEHLGTGEPVDAELETDERVLARISDGIYRQPASALRELVSNAYDADATEVVIQTDAPRFQEIRVHDNGNGMSIDTLANVIHHIGGSSKRTKGGAKLGVTDNDDPTLTPNGRKLIGKIGIGLFSVAQLSHQFQIITKRKNDDFRLVADVILFSSSDDSLSSIDQGEERFRTGTVRIWTVEATDPQAHGTDIIIKNLLPRVREELQSLSLWQRVDGELPDAEPAENTGTALVPNYHIGRVDANADEKLKRPAVLPWHNDDKPDARFKKLVDAVLKLSDSNRRLDVIFDTYLQTLWALSLAAPLDYVDKHPFDTLGSDDIEVFGLSNKVKGQSSKIELQSDETLRSNLSLISPVRKPGDSFDLIVDGIKLARPQPYLRMPKTANVITYPLLFAGKFQPDFSGKSADFTGGPLSFEAYLMWTPKVVPKDNQGVLVRIHDASGTAFDPKFMNYQVAEIQRLPQITAEIFVERGLEAALNIDRESFNTVHPHYQIIVKWVHSALRQLINKQKEISGDSRRKSTIQKEQASLDAIERLGEKIVERAFSKYGNNSRLMFEEDMEKSEEIVVPDDVCILSLNWNGADARGKSRVFNQQRKYVMRILDGYGLLGDLRDEEILSLFDDITQMLGQEA